MLHAASLSTMEESPLDAIPLAISTQKRCSRKIRIKEGARRKPTMMEEEIALVTLKRFHPSCIQESQSRQTKGVDLCSYLTKETLVSTEHKDKQFDINESKMMNGDGLLRSCEDWVASEFVKCISPDGQQFSSEKEGFSHSGFSYGKAFLCPPGTSQEMRECKTSHVLDSHGVESNAVTISEWDNNEITAEWNSTRIQCDYHLPQATNKYYAAANSGLGKKALSFSKMIDDAYIEIFEDSITTNDAGILAVSSEEEVILEEKLSSQSPTDSLSRVRRSKRLKAQNQEVGEDGELKKFHHKNRVDCNMCNKVFDRNRAYSRHRSAHARCAMQCASKKTMNRVGKPVVEVICRDSKVVNDTDGNAEVISKGRHSCKRRGKACSENGDLGVKKGPSKKIECDQCHKVFDRDRFYSAHRSVHARMARKASSIELQACGEQIQQGFNGKQQRRKVWLSVRKSHRFNKLPDGNCFEQDDSIAGDPNIYREENDMAYKKVKLQKSYSNPQTERQKIEEPVALCDASSPVKGTTLNHNISYPFLLIDPLSNRRQAIRSSIFWRLLNDSSALHVKAILNKGRDSAACFKDFEQGSKKGKSKGLKKGKSCEKGRVMCVCSLCKKAGDMPLMVCNWCDTEFHRNCLGHSALISRHWICPSCHNLSCNPTFTTDLL